MSKALEIAHPEKLSGLRPVKFEQLEARVHLNTVTWPCSRLIGQVGQSVTAQYQCDHLRLYEGAVCIRGTFLSFALRRVRGGIGFGPTRHLPRDRGEHRIGVSHAEQARVHRALREGGFLRLAAHPGNVQDYED